MPPSVSNTARKPRLVCFTPIADKQSVGENGEEFLMPAHGQVSDKCGGRRGRGDWKASHPHDYFWRTFKGDAIGSNSHFPSRGSADALVRRTCADG